MTKQIKYFIFAALFIVFMAAISILYPALKQQFAPPSPDVSEVKTQELPEFSVETKEGEYISIKDFEGKPTIINFWASWCGPCKSEMPMLEEMYQKYAQDINFVMINLTDGSRETKAIADDFIATNKYTFPVFYDSNNQEAAAACGVSGIPATLFVSSDGEVVSSYVGAMNEETFLTELKGIYTKIE